MFKLTPNMFNNKTMKNFLNKTKPVSRPKSSNSFFVAPRKYILRAPPPNKKKHSKRTINYLHFMNLPSNQFTRKKGTYKVPNYPKNIKTKKNAVFNLASKLLRTSKLNRLSNNKLINELKRSRGN